MFYTCILAIVRFLLLFVFRISIKGKENILKTGPFILAVNHKSFLDPVIAALASPRHLSFMAKAELFKIKFFGGFISKLGAFPVHRGTGDINALKTAFKILKSGEPMLIFPEGGRVKPGQTRRAKSGVVVIAHKMNVPVIPVLIEGEYKWMHKIKVTIGVELSFDEYKDKKLESDELQTLAQGVLDTIYSLGKE